MRITIARLAVGSIGPVVPPGSLDGSESRQTLGAIRALDYLEASTVNRQNIEPTPSPASRALALVGHGGDLGEMRFNQAMVSCSANQVYNERRSTSTGTEVP